MEALIADLARDLSSHETSIEAKIRVMMTIIRITSRERTNFNNTQTNLCRAGVMSTLITLAISAQPDIAEAIEALNLNLEDQMVHGVELPEPEYEFSLRRTALVTMSQLASWNDFTSHVLCCDPRFLPLMKCIIAWREDRYSREDQLIRLSAMNVVS